MKFYRSLYLKTRFYLVLVAIIIVMVLGYFLPAFFIIGKILFISFSVLLVFDILLLYAVKDGVKAKRECPDKLSNGDQNKIRLFIKNSYAITIFIKIIDELPFQFQVRDFKFTTKLKPNEDKLYKYNVRPLTRGEYQFGRLNIYVSGWPGFAEKRYYFDEDRVVPVYPSFIQMRKFELLAVSNKLTMPGIKKIRRIGRNIEFDRIRQYVVGDDYRTINWKATARKAELMVNQFQDERSQQVYSVIDMGRSMKMPFNGMTLLDYAINSSLVISNIAIHKHDKAGLITFSNKINTILAADRKNNSIYRFLEVLYNQKTDFLESDFNILVSNVARRLNQRSLLLVYTNFESFSSFNRQMTYLKRLSKNHLVVVIFFENTEIKELLDKKSENLEEIYIKTIAEKFAYEKRLIVKELEKNGIHAILTRPENLSVETINKYLELKALGLI